MAIKQGGFMKFQVIIATFLGLVACSSYSNDKPEKKPIKSVELPIPTLTENVTKFDKNALIEVQREPNIHNPWDVADIYYQWHSANNRFFPIILPPRYLEKGYEWRNYSYGSPDNNMFYIGTPSDKKPNFLYQINNDGDTAIDLKITDLTTHKNRYQQILAVFPADNSENAKGERIAGLQPEGYRDLLNQAFEPLADKINTQWFDEEYVFNKSNLPSTPDTLVKGCVWQPLDRKNLYQWGKARIDFRTRWLLQPVTYCSDKYVAVAYLSHSLQVSEHGQKVEFSNDGAIYVLIFDRQTLQPFNGGETSVFIPWEQLEDYQAGKLRLDKILVNQSKDPNNPIELVFNDGKKLSYPGLINNAKWEDEN